MFDPTDGELAFWAREDARTCYREAIEKGICDGINTQQDADRIAAMGEKETSHRFKVERSKTDRTTWSVVTVA